MQGLLISNNDSIDVKIFVGKGKNNEIYAHEEKESLMEYEILEDSVEEVKFVFRRPAYKDEVNLVSGSVIISDAAGLRVDPAAIRYKRMRSLLVGWSLVDQNDKKIPVNSENIDKLHPRVAGTVLNVLDELLV